MSDSNKLVLTAVIGILVGLILGRLLWYNSIPTLEDSEYEESTSASTGEGAASSQTATSIPVTKDVSKSAAAPKAPTAPSPRPAATSAGASSGQTAVSRTSVGSVGVGDQEAGMQVFASLETDQTVWVTVRDYDAGKLGNILGATKFGPGRGTVAVQLRRATEFGNEYAVVLHPYNNGVLQYAANVALRSAGGARIEGTFTAL